MEFSTRKSWKDSPRVCAADWVVLIPMGMESSLEKNSMAFSDAVVIGRNPVERVEIILLPTVVVEAD